MYDDEIRNLLKLCLVDAVCVLMTHGFSRYPEIAECKTFFQSVQLSFGENKSIPGTHDKSWQTVKGLPPNQGHDKRVEIVGLFESRSR